jgi:signal transduction histidine kinase
VVAPLAALGIGLLCAGLLRAQKRATQELVARERAEAELRSAHDLLERRVDLRTAELREVIEGLEGFNRSVSHDLRGPLGGIVGLALMARDCVAAGDRATAERWLQMIQAQAETCEKLVDSFLALARASDAKLSIQRVDTQAIVREVLESLRITRAAVELPVSVAPLPQIEADAELARQVFTNLLGNALKFSASAPKPEVEVGATGESDNPIIFVRDNGAGFSADEAQRLFRPFNRLHGDLYEGFGVGLSIVKRIIDRHGGKVWARGEPGLGATFFFTFGRSSPAHRGGSA